MSSRTFGTHSGVATGSLGKYHLEVTARDVVRSAGGWLFDRAMAGWDDNDVMAEDCDSRPLQILGVRNGRREVSPATPT